MGFRNVSIAVVTVTLAIIGIKNAASISRSPESNQPVELQKWVLELPRTSGTVSIVSPTPDSPAGVKRTESFREAANPGQGGLDNHHEGDEPAHETRIDSWSAGPQATVGSTLYLNGRNLSQVEVYLDGVPLDVELRKDWVLDLQLPDYPVTGPLEYYDPATSEYHILADSFTVQDSV